MPHRHIGQLLLRRGGSAELLIPLNGPTNGLRETECEDCDDPQARTRATYQADMRQKCGDVARQRALSHLELSVCYCGGRPLPYGALLEVDVPLPSITSRAGGRHRTAP